MKINRIKFLSGPNYYSYKPTIWVELDIEELEGKPSNKLPGFTDRLLKVIPTLETHTCSRGYEGGFVERLREGTWIGHILEHIAIELQSLAGIPVRRGKTITSERKGIYFVTYRYEEKESGIYAFHAAMEIVQRVLDGQDVLTIDEHVKEIERLYYENKLGPSTDAIYRAACERKIPVEQIGNESVLRLGTGKKQKTMHATISSQTSFVAVENACDKEVTKTLLREAALPVPDGKVLSDRTELVEAARQFGFPLVLKPLNGRQGHGVITNITSEQELIASFERLSDEGRVILERFFEGGDYRFVVINGKVQAVSLRLPPYVTGNGVDSIETLIVQENDNPLRGDGHEKPMTKIPINDAVVNYLTANGFTLQSIPENGQIIELLGNANLSTGGQAIDVTDTVHSTYRDLAERSARAVGLDIAGIDMIIEDISARYKTGHAAIIEVNAAPGIRMHHFPSAGKARDIGGAIVDYLFKNRQEASIPIVAVTGTNGKTTTARLIAHFLKGEGKTIGMANSDGVYIGDHCIDEGDCSGPVSARKVLHHPEVDAAVLETARGGMLREGTAFRYCDIGIVTNVSEDHLGLDGIETMDELRKLKRLIPELVHPDGYCVLNADDLAVAEMSSYTKGEVIYTSLSGDNRCVLEYLERGGEAWYIEGDWILHAQGGSVEKFMKYQEIPITFHGYARHNISNLLQAIASAHALGVPFAELQQKAVTFFPDFYQSPGRFNKVDHAGRTIVVDYAHNIAGLKAIYDTVKAIPYERMITVVSAPGDRLDADVQNIARIVGRETDLVVVKEDANLRGRKPHEVATILDGELKKHILDDGRFIELNELKAFRLAWKQSNPGDLVLLLYDTFGSVEAFMKELKRKRNFASRTIGETSSL